MVEQSGTALLLEQICNHHEDNIMPLGAFKAALMGTAGVSAEADVVLLSTQTASSSASLTFSSDITSTYGEYIFKFYNLNPADDAVNFTFQVNVVGEDGYNDVAITSVQFQAYHEDGTSGADASSLGLRDNSLDNEASYQILKDEIGNDAHAQASGEMHLFNPASTTYVKHFFSRIVGYNGSDNVEDGFTAGYLNEGGAVDDVQFKMSAGNFDGKIQMWGVK